MVRFFKIIVFIILLLLLAVMAFVFTFDANNYKPEIIEQVEQQTGREFDIAGDIGLSIFPWIGLKIEDVTLGNAAGFTDAHMVKLSQLDVKVMVLPLLKKEVSVDKVRLHGLSVSLETNAQGVTNWDDLVKPAAEPKAEVEPPPREGGLPLAGLAVNGIEFIDARVRWIDAVSGMQATVSELSLETGAIAFDQPVDVEFKARVQNNQPEVDARIALNVAIQFNEALNQFSANDLALQVETMMQAISKDMITLQLETDASANLQTQSARLRNTRLSALGAVIDAQLDVTGLDATPTINGSISSNSIDARALAARLGIELPPMANADSLKHVAFSTDVNATPSSAALESFRLELDRSVLSGWLRLPDFAGPSVRYQLSMDAIDLNDYMPPPAETATQAEAGAKEAPVPSAPVAVATGDDRIPPDVEIPLPVDLLKQLDLDGVFNIGAIKLLDYAITDFNMVTKAANGVVDIKPLAMKLLDGEFSTTLKLDVNALPSYTITANANNLHAGPVVNPVLAGIFTEKEVTLDGAAFLKADISTKGSSVNTLKQAAKGRIDFDMSKTSLYGVDIEYFMRNAIIDYFEAKKLDLPADWRGEYKPAPETAFNKIHATVTLDKGIATNRDFIMDSKRIKVTGEGTVDIMRNTMDYNAIVDLTPHRVKTVAERVLDEPNAVHIHGPLEALAFDVDTSRMATTVGNIAKEKAKAEAEKKLEEEKARLKAKAEAEKKAAEEKLEREKQEQKEKLEREKQEQKEKLENKLKDKLKGLF